MTKLKHCFSIDYGFTPICVGEMAKRDIYYSFSEKLNYNTLTFPEFFLLLF